MNWLLAARAILALVFGVVLAALLVLDETKGIGLDWWTKLMLIGTIGALLGIKALTDMLPGDSSG